MRSLHFLPPAHHCTHLQSENSSILNEAPRSGLAECAVSPSGGSWDAFWVIGAPGCDKLANVSVSFRPVSPMLARQILLDGERGFLGDWDSTRPVI